MSALEQQIPEGYKHTEAGVIPEDWGVEAIAKNMKLINGYGFKPHQWSSQGLPIIRIQNLNSDDAMFNYFEGIVEDKFHVKKGDILFAWSGSKGSSFGARIWQGAPAILNQHIFRVVPNQKTLTTKYSFYVLRKVQEQIEKMAHGFKSSFVHVKKGDLSSTPLPIPSKEEQTAIANALSDVDALLTELECLIVKKQAIKTATMQQLLTGKTRLPQFATYTEGDVEGKSQGQSKGTKPSELGEIPEDWDVTPLGELVSIQSGESPSKFRFKTDGVPYFKVEQLNNGLVYAEETEYRIDTKKVIEAGSIIFPKRGASILLNKIRVLKNNSFMDTNLMTLTCGDKLNNLFLYNILTYKGLDQVADTTSIPQINNKHIIPFLITVPSIEEQTAIAIILSDMDNEIQTLEQRLAKTRQIKQGMMQQLLTGRTRLPY
jgi:type I restriction enzyme S subunit